MEDKEKKNWNEKQVTKNKFCVGKDKRSPKVDSNGSEEVEEDNLKEDHCDEKD